MPPHPRFMILFDLHSNSVREGAVRFSPFLRWGLGMACPGSGHTVNKRQSWGPH